MSAPAEQRERHARTEALLARGMERYLAGDNRAALEIWREGLEANPGDVQLQAYVSWIGARLAFEDPGALAEVREPNPPVEPRREVAVDANDLAWVAEETPAGLPEPPPWYPPSSPSHEAVTPVAPSPFDGIEAPVRRFLAQAPTRPNLAPLDLPELNDEHLAELAGDTEERITRSSRSPAPPPSSSPPRAQTTSRFGGPPSGSTGTRHSSHGSPGPSTLSGLGAPSTPPDFTATPSPVASAPAGPTHGSPSPSERERRARPHPSRVDDDTRKTGSPFAERMRAMRRALDRGDLEVAVEIAEELVSFAGDVSKPMLSDHQSTLASVYQRALGDHTRAVCIGKVSGDLDPRSAFLLSRVDGSFTIDDLLDISGMERPAASRLVVLLLRSGALIAS